ncbi:MAG: hypothetical protein IKC00_02145 [Clostridia bacterium]|nr:hypothetical protein [Clostridia bacterium]
MQNELYNNEVQTSAFKCVACGNNLVYDPKSGNLVCPYCGNEEEIADLKQAEELRFDENVVIEKDDEIEVFRCENCGATSERVKNAIAFACPYCHKTNVVLCEDIKGTKVNAVVPFKLTVKEASVKTREWLKTRFFAKRSFVKSDFETLLNGVYSPCWTFDTYTFSTYEGRLGKTVTRTTGSGKNRRTTTTIVWRNVSGSLPKYFDEIKIYSGSQLNVKDFKKIASFDTNNALEYNKNLLAGYTAMHYEKDLKEGFNEAKAIIHDTLKKQIVSSYNCDVVGYLNINTSYSRTTYKNVLLPFYVGGYGYKGKKYNVFVNGVSGKVSGKFPLSPVKITLVVLLGLALIAAVAYLLSV